MIHWNCVAASEYESEDGRFYILKGWQRFYGRCWMLSDQEHDPNHKIVRDTLKECKQAAERILMEEKNFTLETDGMLLEVHHEQEVLYHLTTKDRVKSIKDSGLIPSMFGDMDVDGNDGQGVYAVLAFNENPELAAEIKGADDKIAVVKFKTSDKWYRCIRDYDYEKDKEERVNRQDYIIHPSAIPVEDIKDVFMVKPI